MSNRSIAEIAKKIITESVGKKLTVKQKTLVKKIEDYLGFKIKEDDVRYVKNKIINLYTTDFEQHQLHAIENYGKQFDLFRVEPGGASQISLIMTK
jgi:hypothetical protein